jgi:nucleoside-diphosphate-sugar epimerase
MSKIVVIGATGHIGTYLVPRLVQAGHDVIAVSRGSAAPYRTTAAWNYVQRIQLDRQSEEAAGSFGGAIAGLGGDIVIDLICFTLASSTQLADALAGNVNQLIHIGTIWTHGASGVVPTPESAVKHPFGEYGIAKAAIEADLLQRAYRQGFPVSIVHPGHIVGPGWAPLNPAGHFNPSVFSTIAKGKPLVLPNFGLETVHHVHADDVAQVVIGAVNNPAAANGQSFHAVSSGALTLKYYAESMFRWFGKQPDLSFLPFEAWAATQDEAEAKATWEHIARSPNCSIDKAKRLLGYNPRYTSLEAVQEAVDWLIDDGQVLASA